MNEITNDNIKCNIALTALYDVIDPEIGLNVVDLGLIYEINFDETAQRIKTDMTLTTQFCPMGDSIVGNVTQSLQDAFPAWEIVVNLTFDPPWNYSRISPDGQEFLGR
ncbi:MAG: metal-sulfur cluster assembly factor [Chitinophagaceae bacterium]|nr:MAG: putative metal-sulfur cluster biosynthetic enzyme [Bacteroidetes bacterium OLB11]MCC6448139.1 metal-sulfur cluster assembly factor [Chitinophagaceae bacterium]HMN33088.1 metal-sulfur cluster assembly factor [Chitinophagaceae bacterium]